MRPLTIRLLGQFQVWRKEDLIPHVAWPTQKCKTLLKIVLTERGHVVHRDRLIELLWPELAPESASSSLHVAISQLRRLLEPNLERPGHSRYVLTRSGGYLFQTGEDCWVDVDASWEALSRGKHWVERGEWGPAVASFRTAEDLYHGDYLQEDLYEEWAIGPRERLREAYLACLSQLARSCARLGELDEAVAACEKILARDPVRESAYRQLMTYHYRRGDRDQALRAYERCRAALAETLGVAPMPQTRHLHGQIAAGLEALYAGRAETVAGRLARHYAEAGQDDKTLHYLIVAGDQAAEQYAHAESLTHFNRALEITKREGANREQLIHLYTRRGRVLELDAQYGEALANYEEMEALARRLEHPPAELTALMAQVTLHATLTLFDEARAEELAERAVALARDLDDRAAEAKLLWNLSLLYRNTNRLPEAVDCGERSLALSRELGLQEQAAFALHDLGGAYFFLGRLARSEAAFEEAGELWRELDNVPMLADSLAGLSQVFTFTGDYERALAASEQAFEMGASIDNVWVKANSKGGHIGFVYWEMGRPDTAIPVLKENVRLIEEAGLDMLVFYRAFRGFVYGLLGDVERGLEILHQELKVAKTKVRFAMPVVRGMLAQLHLQNDEVTAAEALINQSSEASDEAWGLIHFVWLRVAECEVAFRQGNVERALALTADLLAELRDFGAGSHIQQALAIQGQALLASGNFEAAGQTLQKARAKAEASGSRQRLWQILAALAKVETRRGNEEQAERLRREAREILQEIAGHIPTPKLRASFLARPDVRAMLKKG